MTTMTLLIVGIAGLVLGFLLGMLRASARLQACAEERATAAQEARRVPELEGRIAELSRSNVEWQTKIAELVKQAEADREKIAWLDKAEAQLREAFQALAANALKDNTDQLANSARERVVEPLEKSLRALDQQVRQMEEKREGAYKSLDAHIAHLQTAYNELRSTTTGLATALTSSSGKRGEWGEVQMRRIVELAGMVKHVDFEEQGMTDSGKPDMIVHLPNSGVMPIDAKTTMKSYVEAMEAADDASRRSLLQVHAGAVRSRIRDLAGKQYWKQFEKSPDFIVMFVPHEGFLSGALEGDRGILEYAFSQRVLIATPVTFLALLRTVAYAWQQQGMAENAREIASQAQQLSGRLGVFVEHLRKTGKDLDSVVRSYNDAIGSLQSRVLPSVRRFRELGVEAGDVPDVPPVDRQATLPPLLEGE